MTLIETLSKAITDAITSTALGALIIGAIVLFIIIIKRTIAPIINAPRAVLVIASVIAFDNVSIKVIFHLSLNNKINKFIYFLNDVCFYSFYLKMSLPRFELGTPASLRVLISREKQS